MTVWNLPADTWDFSGAHDGDLLARQQGDVLLVGRLIQGTVQWLGPLPAGALEVPAVTEPTQRGDLLDRLTPLAQAAAHLGE